VSERLYCVTATVRAFVLAPTKADAVRIGPWYFRIEAAEDVRARRIVLRTDIPSGVRHDAFPDNHNGETICEHIDREAAERTAKAEAMGASAPARPESDHERLIRERLAELGLEPMPEREAMLLREEAEDDDSFVCVGGTVPARRGREELERQLAEARGALREEIAKRLEAQAELEALRADVRALRALERLRSLADPTTKTEE